MQELMFGDQSSKTRVRPRDLAWAQLGWSGAAPTGSAMHEAVWPSQPLHWRAGPVSRTNLASGYHSSHYGQRIARKRECARRART